MKTDIAQSQNRENREKRTTINIALTEDDKRFLKIRAAQNGTTVAAMIHEYVELLREERSVKDG